LDDLTPENRRMFEERAAANSRKLQQTIDQAEAKEAARTEPDLSSAEDPEPPSETEINLGES